MRIVWWIGNGSRRAGNRHARAGAWEKAAQAYRRHVARRPRDWGAWVQLGHAEKELGNLASAVEAYRHGIGNEDANPDALLHLAHLLRRLGRLEDALVAFRRLERLSPTEDAAEAVRQLTSFHWVNRAITPAGDPVLIMIDDYLDAVESSGGDNTRIEPAFVAVLLADPHPNVHFVTIDTRNPDDCRFAAIDPSTLQDTTHLAATGTVFELRIRARPLTTVARCVLVLPGIPRDDAAFVGVVRATEQGARIAVLGNVDIKVGADTNMPLTDLLHVADLIVTPSAEGARELRLLAVHEQARISVAPFAMTSQKATVGDAARMLVLLRDFAATPSTGGASRLHVLPEGVTVRAGAAPKAGVRAGPIVSFRWLFATGFGRVDQDAAWLRRDRGAIRFRVMIDEQTPVAVLIALMVAPGALGRRCSIAFAGTPDFVRRWTVMTAERLLLRIEGYCHPDRPCELELRVDDVGAIEDGPTVGVAAIGYHRLDCANARRDLRDAFLGGEFGDPQERTVIGRQPGHQEQQ